MSLMRKYTENLSKIFSSCLKSEYSHVGDLSDETNWGYLFDFFSTSWPTIPSKKDDPDITIDMDYYRTFLRAV